MLADYFLNTLWQILILFAFIAAGFIMRKTGILNNSAGETLSALEVNLFMPAYLLLNLATNFKITNISGHLTSIAISICFLLFLILISGVLARVFEKDKKKRGIMVYLFAFSNYGYFGYPMVSAIYGEQVMANMIIFAIPFTFTIYTYGVYLLTGDMGFRRKTKSNYGYAVTPSENGFLSGAQEKPKRKRIVFMPSMVLIAVVLGVTLGLSSASLPPPVLNGLRSAGNCMTPVAMILTGYIIAAYPVKGLFISVKPYLVALVRLIILPVFIGSLMYGLSYFLPFLRGENLFFMIIISAMPVGMNIVVFSEKKGNNSHENAQIFFISYLLVLFTLPAIFYIISALM